MKFSDITLIQKRWICRQEANELNESSITKTYTMAKKTGAKPKYKTPLMGVFVRVANEKDKKVIRKTEKELLTKHLIKND